MTALLRMVSRFPPGPHFMPCAAEHACELVRDGKVLARTKFYDMRTEARYRASLLAKRRGITILGDLL